MEVYAKAETHIPWQIKPWDVCFFVLFSHAFSTGVQYD